MIVYTSRTGNVEYIVSKLNLPSIKLTEGLKLTSPYLIFTYTDGLGEVPKQVSEFLRLNNMHCKGVIASGNSNFGKNNFCGCADEISKQYDVPVVHKIELRGFKSDYELIRNYYNTHLGGN